MFHHLDRERPKIIRPAIVDEHGRREDLCSTGHEIILSIRKGEKSLEEVQAEHDQTPDWQTTRKFPLHQVLRYFQQ